jgi:hypothetical protein
LIVYELLQYFSPGSILDWRDMIATLIAGIISRGIYEFLFKKLKEKEIPPHDSSYARQPIKEQIETVIIRRKFAAGDGNEARNTANGHSCGASVLIYNGYRDYNRIKQIFLQESKAAN